MRVACWIIAGALLLRLVLAVTHDGYLGVDGGAYLLSRNAVLGDEPTGAGFPRPPLAPGFQAVALPVITSSAARFRRSIQPRRVKLPPTYTSLPFTANAETVLSASGFQLVAAPVETSSAAIRLRAWFPMWVNCPPT